MLNNQNSVFDYQLSRMLADKTQHTLIISSIRRIEEDDVDWPSFFLHVAPHVFGCCRICNLELLIINAKGVHVHSDQRTHLPRLIDKRHLLCTARQSFNSDSTGSGTQVKKPRTLNLLRENIEQSLAQTIRSRPRALRRRTLQTSSAIFARN